MRPLPTFSGLGRGIECDGPVVLPQVQTDSIYGKRGHGRHAFVARAINHGRDAALADATPEQAAELAKMDLNELLNAFRFCGPVRSEVTFAIDPMAGTARELGENLDRKYEEAGADITREIVGTLDLFALTKEGDEAVIVDMKGREDGDAWQLRAQALALARALRLSRVWVAFAHAREDGSWGWAQAEAYTALELDGFEATIAARIIGWRAAEEQWSASGRTPDVHEGDHCHRCPSARYCPAKNAMIRAAGGSLQAMPQDVALLTNEEKGIAWLLVRRYLPMLEKLKAALKEAATLEPIDLGTTEVRVVPGNDVLDEEVTNLVLVEHYGRDLAEQAATRKFSKAGITRALGDKAEEAIELIRAAGGIAQGEPQVKEVKKANQPKRRLR